MGAAKVAVRTARASLSWPLLLGRTVQGLMLAAGCCGGGTCMLQTDATQRLLLRPDLPQDRLGRARGDEAAQQPEQTH
jgi:hypothetical protein